MISKLRYWWVRRWMAISLICLLGTVTYLMGGQLTETRRLNAKIDTVRIPLCTIMFTALSRPPIESTPTQLQARKIYLDVYGADGLHCPKALPPEASLPIPPQ